MRLVQITTGRCAMVLWYEMATSTYFHYILECCVLGSIAGADSLESLMDTEQGLLSLNLRQSREVHWLYNGCIPVVSDYQTYYDINITEHTPSSYWVEVDDDKMLPPDEENPRVPLPWAFPFYGHEINHIFPSRIGYIAMSETPEGKQAPHFVAPLVAHANDSYHLSPVYVDSTDEMVIVEWRDMFVRNDSGSIGINPCKFQVIMLKNGTIVFLYRKLPYFGDNNSYLIGIHGGVKLRVAGSDDHDDVNAFVSYQSSIVDQRDVLEGIAVTFVPKSYCDLWNDSQLCESDDVSFYCKHCNFTTHCKLATDKLVHEWLFTHCSNKVPQRCRKDHEEEISGFSPTTALILVGVVAVTVWTVATGAWCVYAYRHPTSPSGRWLIEHRPSQWRALFLTCIKTPKKEQREDKTKTVELDDEGLPKDGDNSADQ